MKHRTRLLAGPLAVVATACLFAITSVAAPAAAATGWAHPTRAPAPIPRPSDLSAVAATSGRNVWAVGFHFNGPAEQTQIRHWNGRSWRLVPAPSPGGSGNGAISELLGVAAPSPRNAWAVGSYSDGTAFKMLILHWNGRSWKQMPSHFPGCLRAGDGLYGVSATSASDAWAVGRATSCIFGDEDTVILHWNGHTWSEVTSPDPGLFSNNILTGVTARSARDAWAVGAYSASDNGPLQSLIVHWNGHSWTQVPSPNPLDESIGLTSVAAVSATNAWAVGLATTGSFGSSQSLAFHWNGKSWQQARAPEELGQGLTGVATTRSAAWAVGFRVTKSPELTLTERWTGSSWKRVASPSPGPGAHVDGLQGVAVVSGRNAWAVGAYSDKATLRALIEHWNGRTWQVQG